MLSFGIRKDLIALGVSSLLAAALAQTPDFGGRVDLGLIENQDISEASGMAASQKNKEVLWVHNDSGDENRVFAVSTSGAHLGVFMIENARARDWEDMALGPGPEEGKDYLYLGDIGDNGGTLELKYIYRVMEPLVQIDQAPRAVTLTGAEIITFKYPDGNRDAETLMIDPRTRDLYVISKREENVHVYRAGFPQSTSEIVTLEYIEELHLGGVVAGDISRAGDEILIKTYDAVYYWKRGSDQSIAQALSQAPARVPYVTEPQGEAVCWHPEGSGYYTVSEEFQNIPAHLYFYPRLNSNGVHTK